VALDERRKRHFTLHSSTACYGKVGHEPVYSSPDAVRARIVQEQKAFAKAVKDANLKPE